MTWSAGRTAITPVVERAPTNAAPSVTAAQVSRPIGSAITFSFGSFGSCFRTSGAWISLVITKTFLRGTTGRIRSTVCCRNERFPSRVISCLGDFSRLTGQKRSPFPPAMMTTKRSLLDSAFMVFNGSHQRFYKSGHTGNKVGFLSAPSYLVDDGAADHDSFS